MDEPVDELLGSLESQVMEIIWLGEQVSVADVHAALAADRPLAYTTVMTVMTRLTNKGILVRERQGRAYVYRPSEPGRGGFLRQQARLGVRRLLAQFGDLAVAEFVDEVSEHDVERLDALARLVAEHQAGQDSAA